MKFTPNATATAKGPAENFTGDVYIDGICQYVTNGIGYVGTRTNKQEIRPGDVVYIEPNEEHWHGATPDHFMSHIAMQQADEQGNVVTWGSPTRDDEYGG